MQVFAPLLPLLTALALVLAPILPGVVHADRNQGAQAQADHAAHGAAMDHQVHDGTAAEDTDSPCAQHQSCHGQCCATCVQCFTGTVVLAVLSTEARPVQTPTVLTLRDTRLITFLNRPPSRA